MKIAKTTNVTSSSLNYDRYSMTKYDRDIVNSIPFHEELHRHIQEYVKKHYKKDGTYSVIDLGAGTGLTSAIVREVLPNAKFDLVDFSKQMLAGAKKKLGTKNVNYILKDYANLPAKSDYHIAIAVIGVHHQTHEGKRKLFKKIYRLLKPGGVFFFGDLMTHRDKVKAAHAQALHFHHLVQKSTDQKTLAEWAHHHLFLNNLAPIEDQIEWLKDAGFTVKPVLLKWNTALLICKK